MSYNTGMADKLSDNRLVRNEQKNRIKNVKAKDAIKKYFHDDKKVKDTPIAFDCECSDPNCSKHVKVSIDRYEETHKRKDRFTIAKGHNTPAVEKVVAKEPRYDVVEKAELDP
jgi:hypothetical protein